MEQLTARQRETLQFVIDELEARGMPPTLREIVNKKIVTTIPGARYVLLYLEKKGYVETLPRIARGIMVRKRPDGSPYKRGELVSAA